MLHKLIKLKIRIYSLFNLNYVPPAIASHSLTLKRQKRILLDQAVTQILSGINSGKTEADVWCDKSERSMVEHVKSILFKRGYGVVEKMTASKVSYLTISWNEDDSSEIYRALKYK